MRPQAAAMVAALALVGLPACASAVAGPRTTDLAAIVEAWRVRTPVPGLVVAVQRDGADVETLVSGSTAFEGGRELRADDRFRVASITKLFVATVVLQLVDEGLLSLDDPAEAVVGPVEGVPPADLARLLDGVTVRHLLSHTSGIPDYGLASGFIDALIEDRANSWTPGEVIALVAGRARDFPPGTGYSYSNTNFVILGEMVRRATGDPWEHEVSERILEPLALSDTGFDAGAGVVPGWFDLDGDGFEEVVPGERWPALESSEGAAGVLVSTAADLLTFGRALYGGELISQESLAAMTAPGHLAPHVSGYGLGTEVAHPDYVTPVWGHGGSLPGYRSLLWHVPSTGTTIVILGNAFRANPSDLAELILRAWGDLPS